MLSLSFDLDWGLRLAEYPSSSVLWNLAFDPVARSASQPGGVIRKATRHCLEDVAVLRPRVRAR